MSIEASRYATNPFYCHVERFRDEWLEPCTRGYVVIRDMHLAYDTFCVRNNIRNRKVPEPELLPELSRVGVRLGYRPVQANDERFHRRIAFVGWRLTRNARYAIRDLPRPPIFEYRYPPIGDDTVDVYAYERDR